MTQKETNGNRKPWTNRLKRTQSFGPITHEVTPFVWNDRLYRVENHPRFLDFQTDDPTYRFHEDEVRIRDVETGKIVSVPLRNHYFGEGFVYGKRLYITAGDYDQDLPWRQHKKINMVYFHSGNQQGVAGLELAEFDGPPEQLLAHYFEE